MNILISSLGTGRKKEGGYQTASYKYNDEVITSNFISKALTEFLSIDKLFLVGTTGSIWDSAYEQFGGENEDFELDLYGKIENKNLDLSDLDIINQQIDKKLNSSGSKCFLIDYGTNDLEIWNNFSKYIEILNYIKDGDTVYLDISHSFRSLALMSFVMLEFGNLVKDKKFKVGGIFYGMFEARDESGNTPIIDLKILYDLMQWIKAINSFKKFGNAYGISELLEERNVAKEVKKTFNRFSDVFSIGNISSLQSFIKSSSSKIKALNDSNDPIIKLISVDIIDFFNRFGDKDSISSFQFELAKWYYENKDYSSSYSSLLESLISYECEKNDLNPKREENRKIIKTKFRKKIHGDIAPIFNKIKKVRNTASHLTEGREDYRSDIDNLKTYIRKIGNHFKK